MDGLVDHYIYRTKITLRDGTVIYAKNYGLKAFRIPVYGNRGVK